jgi:murein DD-endopeptidase MepM/ murein hydrolase activator NlpD
MLGLPVHSVLDGKVAAVIHDRQPYGNAVIVETPLEELPPAWLVRLPVRTYDPTSPLQPSTALTCPAYDYIPQSGPVSLYLLYAHFEKPSPLAPGGPVSCGDTIGQVGTTGRSVNPHLHFETRLGPSGMSFASIAHYQNDATVEEMRAYCLWRISGAFKPFDPMLLLSIP